MKRKLVFPIVLALLANLLISSIALAQADQPQQPRHSGRRGVGQITDIGGDQFTVVARNGTSYSVLVNEATRFRHLDGSEAGFDKLQVGQWTMVIATPASGQTAVEQPKFTARLIVLLPDEIDLTRRFGIRARGVVTGTDLAASTFNLRDRNGQILTLAVDENTHFLGQVLGLSDLHPGMNIAAAGQENSQGYPQALIVAARFPIANHAGKIVAIDPTKDSFRLETVRNGTLGFQVDDRTRFRSPDQSVHSLDDLQPDMVATVAARQDGTRLIALLVAVAERSDLPQFDLRAVGKIFEIGDDSFSLEKPSGEQATFEITPDTRFRSPGGGVQNLADLRTGMRVVVGANEMGESYQAVLVVVGFR